MDRPIVVWLSLLTIGIAATAHDGQQSAPEYEIKRCTPKVEKQRPLPKNVPIAAQKGEKATGYSPVISFQILESGEVDNARIKRSSGFAEVDRYALEWIRGTKYNARSGCGVIETNAAISIHWTSGE